MPLNAVDVSNYTGPLSQEALARWKALGVRLVIVQAVDPPPSYPPTQTRQQLQACQDAGLPTDAYLYLWATDTPETLQARLKLLDGFPIRRLWLDCEDAGGEPQTGWQAHIQAALAQLDAYPTLAGQAGLYTGAWWWRPRGLSGFGDRPLWLAQYDGVDDPAQVQPLADWSAVAIKQYAGTSTLSSVGNVDLDAASEVELAAGQPVQRETPTDYPFPDWRRSAIAYRGALDATVPLLSQDVLATYQAKFGVKSWGEIASNLEGIIRQLTAERDAAQARLAAMAAERDRLAAQLKAATATPPAGPPAAPTKQADQPPAPPDASKDRWWKDW